MSSPMQDDESSSAASGFAGAAASAASSAATAGAATKRPSEFGKAFALKLEQLKTTDKQSITSLTVLADEHRARSDEVVEILKRRMQQLPSGDYRLPLMYLIDSICQNLGKKGADYPRKLQPHLKPMLHSMLKHCSIKVKGSLYRMWAAWKKGHTFNKEPLAEIETMFNAFMTAEEREEALARRSATGVAPLPDDPRKRSHAASAAGTPSPSASPSYGTESVAASSAPNAKKAMLLDPRRPPPAPAAPVAPAAMIPEAAQFSMILESPDIANRVELRGVVASMQKQLRRALPIEEMKALVAQLVIQLQQALAVAPPPQPQPQPAAFPLPLPPAQPPTFNPYAPAPAIPLPMPLPPQPPAPAWNPTPLPLPSMIPPYRSPNAQPPPRVEAARPITLSEEDLKTKHPWLADSLYTAIPLVCKSCGRRIHTSTEMGAHLDWHFAMSKRAAHIAKTQSGSKWQNWYWEQDEWIMATDVIFGVQNRTPGSAAASKAKGAAGSAAAAAAAKGYTPASLVADDTQTACAICSEEFKKEWSDEDENWMYREVLRLGSEEVLKAKAEIARIEAEKPQPTAPVQEMDEEARALAAVASGGSLAAPAAAPSASAAAVNSTQSAALASKESDRLQSLWRAEKTLKHSQMFCGRLVHQACHYGVMANIAKMVRPKEGEDKDSAAAAAAEGEQKEQGRSRDGASPAPGAAAAKVEFAKPEPLPVKTETKVEPLPALE